MQPGRATNSPPQFPDGWCGLWKDPTGKAMYIRRIQGRHLAVSFSAGISQPFFPLEQGPNGQTCNLSGVYMTDQTGRPYLRVDAGDPEIGPFYNIRFVFGEGDRLRTAENWDVTSGVIARPKVTKSTGDEYEDNTGLSWAFPLANYWKSDEEEAMFLACHSL